MEGGPHFLDEEFLQCTLEDGYKCSDVTILGYEAKLASFGGENYFSDIYRVKVDYELDDGEPKEVHLILKAMKATVDRDLGMKSKETPMNREVLPELEAILGGDVIFSPKLFTEIKSDYEAYVFEDLNALGYELKDREVGLNENDCISVLKKIAKFHAASMVYAQKFPESTDNIKQSMFELGTQISPTLHNHMTGMLSSAAEAVATWEGYESLAEKIYTLRDNFHERTIETLDRTKPGYNVINHGDLWVNNILFKDNDPVFIDFQISNYSSPGLDINYFLYTSVPLEILKTQRYEFYRIYFKEFQETLFSIGFDEVPSWEDFVLEMQKTELSGAWVMLTIFPMLALTKDDSVGNDIETMKNEEFWEGKKKKMYATGRVVETLKYALDRFNDLGVL